MLSPRWSLPSASGQSLAAVPLCTCLGGDRLGSALFGRAAVGMAYTSRPHPVPSLPPSASAPLAVPATAPLATAVAAPVHCSARPAPPAQAPVAGAAAASAALGGGGSVATLFTRAECCVPHDDDAAPDVSKAAALPAPLRVRARIRTRTVRKKARGSPAAERVRTSHGKRPVSSGQSDGSDDSSDATEERRRGERPESGSSDSGRSDSESSASSDDSGESDEGSSSSGGGGDGRDGNTDTASNGRAQAPEPTKRQGSKRATDDDNDCLVDLTPSPEASQRPSARPLPGNASVAAPLAIRPSLPPVLTEGLAASRLPCCSAATTTQVTGWFDKLITLTRRVCAASRTVLRGYLSVAQAMRRADNDPENSLGFARATSIDLVDWADGFAIAHTSCTLHMLRAHAAFVAACPFKVAAFPFAFVWHPGMWPV